MLLIAVFLFYLGAALVFSARLLPVWTQAIPGGLEDTRLFLWNAWWFKDALARRANPFFTDRLFHPFGSSLLSHDFPLWTNLVTFTGQSAGLNLVAANNLWFLLTWALAGFCTFLLAQEVLNTQYLVPSTSYPVLGTRYWVRGTPAVVAGLYVMTHSYALARAMQNWGQFNLYGIALFLWLFVRARRRGRTRDFILAGIALAWTAACHYYFLIYSVAIVLAVVVADFSPWRIRVEIPSRVKAAADGAPLFQRGAARSTRKCVAGGFAAIGGLLAAWIIFWHPGSITIGGARIGLETPYNALLVMWVGLFAWAASHVRVTLTPKSPHALSHVQFVPPFAKGGLGGISVLVSTALLCLSPLLISAVKLALAGGYPKQSILWKTHLPGANLLALFFPNPLHALWGPALSRWMVLHGLQPQEQAAMIGWTCLVIVIWSLNHAAFGMRHAAVGVLNEELPSAECRIPRAAWCWLSLAVFSTVMSLGVYLHVLWINTWMPLPFYLWRLLPVLGNVRVPERWMAVGSIAWGVVLALALVELARRKNWKLNRVCLAAGALILLENWPGIPNGLPPADNAVYDTLRGLPRGGVLPLPLYIGDSSIGAGDAPGGLAWETLGGQIYHHQPLVGGYIGRISKNIIKRYKADPWMDELINLEEAKPSSGLKLGKTEACQAMQQFEVTYVLLYPHAMNPAAFNFVTQTIPVRPIMQSSTAELYRITCN
jgi:hypothetical protein